jgi:hypothetical protein
MSAVITMAAGALLLLPQAVLAGTTTTTELEGMVYVKARPIILSYGWQPLAGPCGGANKSTCTDFPEVGNCSGTGVGFCDMNFARRDRCLVVITVGGEPTSDNRDYTVIRDVLFSAGPCSKD